RFRRGKRIRPVDHHSDLPPGVAQPHRHGQNLGFVVVHALRCCSSIEERAEPRRAETDVAWQHLQIDFGTAPGRIAAGAGWRGRTPLRAVQEVSLDYAFSWR